MIKVMILILTLFLVSCIPSQTISSNLTSTSTPISTHIPPTVTYTTLSLTPTVSSTPITPIPTTTWKHVSILYMYSFLIDELNFFLPPDGPIVEAYPLDENNIFFVVRMRVYSGSELCPGELNWMLTEDTDWISVYETQSGIKPIGFGTPLGQELGNPNPTLLIGRLTGGCIFVNSDSTETFIDLIYVVSKDFAKGVIISYHGWRQRVFADDYTRNVYAIYPSLSIIGDEEIPRISCDPCTIEQLDGTENWTFSP